MGLWIDSMNQIHDDMNGEALALSSWPQGMTQITQAQADAIRVPHQTPEELAAKAHEDLIASAKSALDETDLVSLRCFKSGVAFPADWLTYTTNLRNIVNGTDSISTSLPTKPAYPTGT